MFRAPKSPHLVPHGGKFDLRRCSTRPPRGAAAGKEAERALEERLDRATARLAELQEILSAHDRHAVLLVFQAHDAAGKDGTIRAVMSGVNPTGCQVFSFKQPSREELDHDFLWRTARCLPERGRIGIFNRSYYEEVLVVRVHPEYLGAQNLPPAVTGAGQTRVLWRERYQSIRDHELHLARNGTVILKFFLHVSQAEQRQRFLDRLREPEKNGKFAEGDLAERRRYDDYQIAYREALAATSRSWAPWYVVPADSKRYLRAVVAELVVAALESLGLRYPAIDAVRRRHYARLRRELEREGES